MEVLSRLDRGTTHPLYSLWTYVSESSRATCRGRRRRWLFYYWQGRDCLRCEWKCYPDLIVRRYVPCIHYGRMCLKVAGRRVGEGVVDGYFTIGRDVIVYVVSGSVIPT